MSINGTQYTFDPLTLSGLTLTNSLSNAYVPYSSASNTVNLNQQSLTNVKNITMGIPNDNANIYTNFINGGTFNIWTNTGTADEVLMLNMQYIKDNVLGRYTNYFLYGRLWLYSGDGSTLWMANDSTGIMTFTQGVNIGSSYSINISPATSSTGTIVTYGIGGTTGNSSETMYIKNQSGVTSLYFAGDGTVKAVQNLNALKTLSVGAEIPAGNVTITGAGSTFAILQYGVGGTAGTLSDRLVIRNRAGTDCVLYTDSGNVFQYTGIFSCPSLAVTGITNAFLYNNGSGTATGVQAIFATGTTASASPNICLAGGGAFQVSNTANTQSYLAVQSTGVSSTLPIYGTGVVATGNPSYAAGTTAMWMSVETSNTGVLGAGLYGTNYYPISYRGKTHQWQCDGVERMTLINTVWSAVGVIGSIYTGTRFMPVTSTYMQAGSLCIGSTNNSYGGNTGTSNIAGLMLETQGGGNQEIAIHDYGVTVKSFMYYSGAEQRIYLGRDMGNGWGTCPIAVRSNFQTRVVTSASSNYITFYNQGGNATSYIGCENSSGAGLFGSGQAYGMSLGCVNNSGVSLFQNNSLLTQWFRNTFSEVVQTIPAGSSYTFNIGSGYAFTITPNSIETNKYMRLSNGDSSTCLYGPNSSYGAYLLVGAGTGSQQTSSNTACVKVTNGNLHCDSAVGYSMYLNYYSQGSEILMFGRMSNTYSNNQFGGSCTNNQSVCASFRQNVIGQWIGSRHDSTTSGSTPDCVVLGSLSNGAWIGGHNYNLTAWATLYVANPSFQYPSDERLKENIITANNKLCYENIKMVRLVRYNYKEDDIANDLGKDDKNRLGVIAQEFREIFPRSVMERDDPTTNTSYLSINTDQLYFTLIGCVQQQQLLIEQQQKQIEEQKAQIGSYEERFKHYDALLDSMDQKFKRLGLKIQF
jgi:hypothetical protein